MKLYNFPGLTETQTSHTLAHPFNRVLGDEAAQGSGHGQADGPRLRRPPAPRHCAGHVVLPKPVEEMKGEHELLSEDITRGGVRFAAYTHDFAERSHSGRL